MISSTIRYRKKRKDKSKPCNSKGDRLLRKYDSSNINQHFSLQVQSSVFEEEGELDLSLLDKDYEENDDFETPKGN